MKKFYSTPSVTVVNIDTETLMLTVSKGGVQEDNTGAYVGGSQTNNFGNGGDVDASQYRSGLWN